MGFKLDCNYLHTPSIFIYWGKQKEAHGPISVRDLGPFSEPHELSD